MLRKIVALFVLILFASISGARTQQNKILEICAVSNLPGGWVIVGKTTSDACRTNADLPEKDNAYLIKRPGQREIICEKTPYPGNYAVIAKARSAACPNKSDENYNNAWVIEIIR
jgi:hypothetical protein